MARCFVQNLDPVQGLVDYVLDIKPYHTKIIEVLVEYVYEEKVDVTITEALDWVIGMFQTCHIECIYPIIAVNKITNTFTIRYDFNGLLGETNPLGVSAPLNLTSKFPVGLSFKTYGSRENINDNEWTVQSTFFDPVTGNFTITTDQDITDEDPPFGLLLLPCAETSPEQCDGYGIAPFGSPPGIATCDIDSVNDQIVLAGDHVCEFLSGDKICLTLESFDDASLFSILSGRIRFHSETYAGGPTLFTLPFTILTTSIGRTPLTVFVNGVKMVEPDYYTIVFPNQVNVTGLIFPGDIIEFWGYEGVIIGQNGPLYHRANISSTSSGQVFPLPFTFDSSVPLTCQVAVYVNGVKLTGGSITPSLPNFVTINDTLFAGDIVEFYGDYGACPGGSLTPPPPSTPDYIKRYFTWTGDGITTSFSAPFVIPSPQAGKKEVEVYMNGIKQQEGVNFATVLPSTINFTFVPGAGSQIELYVYNDCDGTQAGFVRPDYHSATGNGVATAFIMPFTIVSVPATKSELTVYINGVKQTRGDSYTLTLPSTVNFNSPVPNGSFAEFFNIEVPQYAKEISLGLSPVHTTPFNIQLPAFPNQTTLEIFINGVKQKEVDSYTITFPNTVTFSSIVAAGNVIEYYGYNNCNAAPGTSIFPDYNKQYHSVTAVGGETVLVLPFTISTPTIGIKTLDVYINGTRQVEIDSFTITLPDTVTLTFPLTPGDLVEFYGYQDCAALQPGSDFPMYYREDTPIPKTVFILPFPILGTIPGQNALQVFINGIKQTDVDAFTITLPNTVTLTTPTQASDTVEFFGVFTPNYYKTDYVGGPFVVNVPFTIQVPFAGQSTFEVFVNGVKQNEGLSYTITYPMTVTFNTLSLNDKVEFYGYGNCVEPSLSSIIPDCNSQTYAGGSTNFVVPFIIETQPPGEKTFEMYVNGIKQAEGVDYAISYPSTVMFLSPLLIGDVLDFIGLPYNCISAATPEPTFVDYRCYTVCTVELDKANAVTACIFGFPRTVITTCEDIDYPPLPPTAYYAGLVTPGPLNIIDVIPYSPAPLVPPFPFPDESAFLDIGSNMFVVGPQPADPACDPDDCPPSDGNYVCRFCQGYRFRVVGGQNEGLYTALYADFVGGQTRIRVIEDIPFTGPASGGQIKPYWFGYSEHREICCERETMCELVRVVMREKLRFSEIHLDLSEDIIAYNLENNDEYTYDLPFGTILSPTAPPVPSQPAPPLLPALFDLWFDTTTNVFRQLVSDPTSPTAVVIWRPIVTAHWLDTANNKFFYRTVNESLDPPVLPIITIVDTGWVEDAIPGFNKIIPAVGAIAEIHSQSYMATAGPAVFTLSVPVPGSNPALLSVTIAGVPAAFILNTATQFTIISPVVNVNDLIVAVVKDVINYETNAIVSPFGGHIKYSFFHKEVSPNLVNPVNNTLCLYGGNFIQRFTRDRDIETYNVNGPFPGFLGILKPTSINIIGVNSGASQFTVSGIYDWLFTTGAIFEVKYFDNNLEAFQVTTSVLSVGDTIITVSPTPFETIITGVSAPFYTKDLGVITGAVYYPDTYTTCVVVPVTMPIPDPNFVNIDSIAYIWIGPLQTHIHNAPQDDVMGEIVDGLGISNRLTAQPDSYHIIDVDMVLDTFTIKRCDPVLGVPIDLTDSFTPGTTFHNQDTFNQINNYASVLPNTGPPGTPVQNTPPPGPGPTGYWYDTSSFARVATTANIVLSGLQTIDGELLVATDRVLVKNQTTTSQNGVYIVSAGAWTRALDFNTPAEFINAHVTVTEGTTQINTNWLGNIGPLVPPPVLGISSILWSPTTELSAVLRQWNPLFSIWNEVFAFALDWTVANATFNSFTGETTLEVVEDITDQTQVGVRDLCSISEPYFGRIIREPVIVTERSSNTASTTITEVLEFAWTQAVDWFQYMVICADTATDTFTLLGNAIAVIQPGEQIELISNNINNGIYTVSPNPLDGPFLDINGNTLIKVTTNIPLGSGLPLCIGAGGFVEPIGGLGATLRFNDIIGVTITEDANATLLGGDGSLPGGWDVPFFDVGAFDESVGENIHLYGNQF